MNYELSFLTPNLSLHEKDDLLKNIEEEIKKLEGKIEEKFIEKKKFAYLVKKENEGFLGIINFSLNPQKIGKLEKEIAENKNILRAMIERKKKITKQGRTRKDKTKPEKPLETKRPIIKKKKVKIEKLDEKLEEILK